MGCKKSCGKSSCNECNADSGPRGFRGPTGPVGPCCTGATGPGTDIVPTFFPTSKPLAATFYGVGPGVVGPGDIFDFPLDGPNDPIGRADSGTFVLPFAGLYKVSWQMPIVQGATGPTGPSGPVFVQSTLTAQTVEEGSFVPVAGGVVGRDAPFAQLVGETIVEATRNNFPIRIENTSAGPTGAAAPVNYYSPIPTRPNQRTVNIASLVPQRTYAAGVLRNNVPQVVAAGVDVTFNESGQVPALGDGNPIQPGINTNVGVTPAVPPFVGLVIQQAGTYVVEWVTFQLGAESSRPFYPYLNGAPLPNPSGVVLPRSSGSVLSSIILQVGDVVTLRNQSGVSVTLDNQSFVNAYLGIYRAP